METLLLVAGFIKTNIITTFVTQLFVSLLETIRCGV